MTLFCEVCGAGPDEISFYPEVSLVEYTCNNGHFTSRTCRADCCDRVFLGSNGPRFKNGLCQGHYQQEKTGKDLTPFAGTQKEVLTHPITPTRMDNMNIWDIDTKVGVWIDGSHWSGTDFDKAVVLLTADHYGYKIHLPTPQTEDDWYYESQDALDYLNSLCPHGYWFYVEDNSLYLGSEDE